MKPRNNVRYYTGLQFLRLKPLREACLLSDEYHYMHAQSYVACYGRDLICKVFFSIWLKLQKYNENRKLKEEEIISIK